MKLIDALLCLVILTVVTLAVRSVIRARKSGKGCGGSNLPATRHVP